MFGAVTAVTAMALLLSTFEHFCCGSSVVEEFKVYSMIQYRIATTRIVNVVRNTASYTQDIGFSVGLPKQAFIVNFTMVTGEKRYSGEIKERTRGAMTSVPGTASTNVKTSRDGNSFAVSLPVDGGQNATYILEYQEKLKRQDGVYEYQVFLNPGQAVPGLIVEVFISENNQLVVVNAPALRPLSQLTSTGDAQNDLARIERPTPFKAHVIFNPDSSHQGPLGLAHVFTIHYDVARSPTGDIIVHDGYFMHFFAADQTPLPKDIIFVLDVSGSMWGSKMQQMQQAMIKIMDDIQTRDRFDIVIFSWGAYQWRDVLIQATPSNIAQAKNFIASLSARGGTNIPAGILTARNVFRSSPGPAGVKMIFFLTDGQNRDPIADDPSIPIYGLAFGDDADMEYIKELSTRNSGFAQKIYTDIDAATQVENFYDRISSVSLTNITFTYDSNLVDRSTLTQTQFPVVFQGSEIVVSGKVRPDVTTFESTIQVVGQTGPVSLNKHVPDIKELTPVKDNTAFNSSSAAQGLNEVNVEKAWALVTIQEKLEQDQKIATSEGNTGNLEKALDLSLQYGFVTPLTSIVVTDPVKHEQLVETAVKDKEEKTGDRTLKFINERPPTTTVRTTTTTTTTTTTQKPWCPPTTSVDEAVKSSLVRLSNVSTVVETCMNTRPHAFKYLIKAMKAIQRITGVPKRQSQPNLNIPKDEWSRLTQIDSFTIQDGGRKVCISPMPVFEQRSSYLLVQCPGGDALYLLTGSHRDKGPGLGERLIVTSPSLKIATIFLGSSSAWNLFGDIEFSSEIKSEFEMILEVACFKMVLQRSTSSLRIIYDIQLYLNGLKSSNYSGLMGDYLKKKSNSGDNDREEDGGSEGECVTFGEDPRKLKKYQSRSKKFIIYFLDLLLDFMKNFKIKLYE
ncbi:unnamed protein product [Lymnaea stagnalis]|uniref:Uncharacterized protein n=1 Tax=Lymnaea stagnalis TaxID=6523 RepID=A0AAV2H0L2_LYMST